MPATNVKHGESSSELAAEDIRRELRRIIESGTFRGSHRCRSFLEFVVGKVLDGDPESLKERSLAVEVFGRSASADLTEDSIVRVGAREVRKRLAQYYMGEGAENPLRVELPPGSYVPLIHLAHPVKAAEIPGETEPSGDGAAAAQPAPAPRPLRRWLIAAALAALAGVAIWQWMSRTPAQFETFWAPAFQQSTPVILAMAHPLVYHPSTRAHLLSEKKLGPAPLPIQRPVDVDPKLLNGSDYVPVFDQYVGFGDTVAALNLGALFAQRSVNMRIRMASKLDFNDLRESATILIGAFTNRWTSELTQSYRFRFGYDEMRQPCLIDAATGKRQSLAGKADDGRSKEDYILIGRIPRSATGRFLFMGAGLTQYGTEEAGRILANPSELTPLLNRLPADWPRRNVELVLHSQVVGDAPTPPNLIASHVW